jgi:hypothetical protein
VELKETVIKGHITMTIITNPTAEQRTREHLESLSRPVNIHVKPSDLTEREYLERIARNHLMDHDLNSTEWLSLAAQAEKDGHLEISQRFLLESMILEGKEANPTPGKSPGLSDAS